MCWERVPHHSRAELWGDELTAGREALAVAGALRPPFSSLTLS